MLTAEIVAIGSELLTPNRTDTNSLWLTEQLNNIGIEVMLKTIVGDDELRLIETISDALRRSSIVITTGGLGPTEDDITRKCAAKALGRELEYKPELESMLRERFSRYFNKMPEINLRQAYIIQGSMVLPNPNGSAVGLMIESDGKYLAILPGPPKENQPMFDGYVMPRLRESVGSVAVARRVLKIVGMGESAVDEIAAPIYSKYPHIQTSILFNKSEVELHLAAHDSSLKAAEHLAAELSAKLVDAFGISVFSDNGKNMEEVVGGLLTRRGETLAVAESCTGGLIAERITSVSGSSKYLIEGAVTYSNEAKKKRLAVSDEILEKYGAVSAECAEAMARGMRESSGADHAISVTGIAGPDGGTAEKPVGTVFLGYANSKDTISKHIVLPGDRELIRWRSSQAALEILRRNLLDLK